MTETDGDPIDAIAFDRLIDRASDNGTRRIRLLKLDCEGSEWPILLTSERLHLIDQICGEFHEIGDHGGCPFRIDGFERFREQELREHLTAHGFEVACHRDPYTHGLGLFFASNRHTACH